MQRTLLSLFGPGHPYAERVQAVRGDITRPGLGVGADSIGWRSGSARSYTAQRRCRSSLALQTARAINADGTRRVLELAERCDARGSLRRFSTSPPHTSPASMPGASARTTSTSASAFATPTSSRSSRPSAWSPARGEISRSRSCARASSSANATAAGRRRSTSSTGRCARSHAAPTRRCPRAGLAGRRRAGRLCRRRDVRPQPGARGRGRDLPSDRWRAREQRRRARRAGERVLRTSGAAPDRPVTVSPRDAPATRSRSRDERSRRALTRSEVFFPYFAARVTYDDRRARVALRGSASGRRRCARTSMRLVEFALAAEWGRRRDPRAARCARDVTRAPLARTPSRVRRTARWRWQNEQPSTVGARRVVPRGRDSNRAHARRLGCGVLARR